MSVTVSVLARALGPRSASAAKAMLAANPLPSAANQDLGSAWTRRWPIARRIAVPATSTAQLDLDAILARPPHRSPDVARRLLFVGDLSPRAGAADLQAALARWADRHPDQAVEITWMGSGDLHVVLDAQPLPANMRHRIVQPATASALVGMFHDYGLLIVPAVAPGQAYPLWEAAATGLLILGTIRSSQTRAVLSGGQGGWLYDPLDPDALHHALTSIMTLDDACLNTMRSAARAHAIQHCTGITAAQ